MVEITPEQALVQLANLAWDKPIRRKRNLSKKLSKAVTEIVEIDTMLEEIIVAANLKKSSMATAFRNSK